MSGVSLTNEARDLLVSMAQDMLFTETPFMRFSDSSCEGCITTRGDHGMIGNVGGTVFHAVVEVEGRDKPAKIDFVMRGEEWPDRDKMRWVTLEDLRKELEEHMSH